MAQPGDPFRQSDVTRWGLVALACGALAVLSANISGLIPLSAVSGLHASRIEGGSVFTLRRQVGELRTETARLHAQNDQILAALSVSAGDRTEVARRIGTIEAALPAIAEAGAFSPPRPGVDHSLLTGSIGVPADGTIHDVQGGAISVTSLPFIPGLTDGMPEDPIPDPPNEIATAGPTGHHAIAIGPTVTYDEGDAAWRAVSARLGTLLFGLSPLLAATDEEGVARLIAGPIADRAQADDLCRRVGRLGADCSIVDYVGVALR